MTSGNARSVIVTLSKEVAHVANHCNTTGIVLKLPRDLGKHRSKIFQNLVTTEWKCIGNVQYRAVKHRHHILCHLTGWQSSASIMALATLSSLAQPMARCGGLRGVGGISTAAILAANI